MTNSVVDSQPECKEVEILTSLRSVFIAEKEKRDCEKSLYTFCEKAWPIIEPGVKWVGGWHIEVLCAHLEAVTERKITRLLINVPPRTSKSSIVSVMWPCWEWIKRPFEKYLCASYSSTLSVRDNVKARQIVTSAWYQKNWGNIIKLKSDQNQKTRFENTQNGYRLATSVEGSATGEGGSRIIIDDPHSQSDAESDVIRPSQVAWFRMTMSSRLNTPKEDAIVVVMQRLHEDDVSGYIIANNNDPDQDVRYTHLCYDRITEILTKDGWIRFDELDPTIEVAQVDPVTLEMSFVVPSYHIKYHYSGDMYYYKNAGIDLLVTPDHRMVYKDGNDFKKGDFKNNWRIRAAKDLPLQFYIPQAVEWNAPDIQSIEFAGKEWKGDDFAKFMGIWLAEGCTIIRKAPRYKDEIYKYVNISQDLGEVHDCIVELIKVIPFKFNRYTQGQQRPNHVHFNCYSKDLYKALTAFGKSGDKYVPSIIKEMSSRQIKIFLEWYAMGDGHKLVKNPEQTHYVSKSKRLIDDVQELMARIGQCGGITIEPNCSRITTRWAKGANSGYKYYGRIDKDGVGLLSFDDEVFCVTVPTGAVFVRRNGKTAVSGNCLPMRYEVNPDTNQRRTSILGDYDPRVKDGQLLIPNRFGEKEVRFLEKELGEYGSAGQLQQRPAPAGGGILKTAHLQLWPSSRDLPAFEYILQSYDTAFTETPDADYTANVTFGIFWNTFVPDPKYCIMIVDSWNEHLSYPKLRKKVIADWNAYYGGNDKGRKGRRADSILVEEKASGISLIQDLIIANVPAHTYNPGKLSKANRAHLSAPVLELDVIYVLESTKRPGEHISWVKPLVKQLGTFPVGKKDLVDAFSQGILFIKENRLIEMPFFEDDEVDPHPYKKPVINPYDA